MLIHITADNDDTFPLPVTFAAGDQIDLDADAVINSPGNAIVGLSEAGGATINLLGSVQAGGSGIDAVSGGNMITIGSTGSISVTFDGMWLGSFGDQTGGNIVQNHGSITTSSAGAAGVLSFTSNNQVTNTGTITSSIGIGLGGTSNNVPLGSNNKVINSGIINASLSAVAIAGDGSSLNNSGTLMSGSTVELDGTAQGTISVINTGTIQSTDGTAITGEKEVDQIDNSGTIIGSVLLNEGNDRYDGRSGSIKGTIALGAGNDVGLGGAGSEVFDGGDDSDILNGGGGDDILDGGAGFDTAIFNGSVAARVDLSAAGQQNTGHGLDTLIRIENLTGGTGADRFTGDGNANQLIGELGADTLTGGGGSDLLNGGFGNDRLDGGSGLDVLRFTGTAAATVNLGLKGAQNTGYGKDTLSSIEILWGGAGADRFTGNSGNNAFIGETGKDMIAGAGGHDTLAGGLGNDRLTGGKGKDVFVFDTKLEKANVDTITDFRRVDDAFRLENAIFGKLEKVGVLSKSCLKIGAKAKDKNDYIIYDKAKGALYYDADGSGKGAAIKFAQLAKGTALDHKDFFII